VRTSNLASALAANSCEAAREPKTIESVSYASETTLAYQGLPQMETLAQYREFAAECYRLASEAKTEADRKTLLEIARAWQEVDKDSRSGTRQLIAPATRSH
jgi:hypothetical protein